MLRVNDFFLLSVVVLSTLLAAIRANNFLLRLCSLAGYSYFVTIIVYRLYFHPLAKFPGPKIAGLTYIYEFYYDVVKAPGGQYVQKLEELHKQYGPILRITPDELQIADAEFFETVYVAGSSKRHRWDRAGTGNTSPGAISSAASHDLHRMRRNSINNFFSKAAVMRLESRLQSRMKVLLEKLEKCRQTGEVVELTKTFSLFTMDTITEYAFGKTENEQNDEFIQAVREGFESLHTLRHFPIMMKIPRSLVEILVPSTKAMTKWENRILKQVEDVKRDHQMQDKRSATRQSLFSEVLDSKLPDSEKETVRIRDEALILVIAGTESTSRVLSYAVYHALANSDILSGLQRELDEAVPDGTMEIPLQKAESLPYLTAVLKEALRHYSALASRSLFTADDPIQYKQWMIQPGVPMCVPHRTVLHDPDIYPDPLKYAPSRWLGDSTEVERRNRHLIAFGRGHRNCLGMNLAWAELYLAAANIFRKFELRLYDTSYERDVKAVRDCFVALPSPESQGVRIEVVGRRS